MAEDKTNPEMSTHADAERLNYELTIEQIEFVLKDCEIIETMDGDEITFPSLMVRPKNELIFGRTLKMKIPLERLLSECNRSSTSTFSLQPFKCHSTGRIHEGEDGV